MCRWAAYCGEPIFLEDVMTRPRHSLIAQSQQAAECKTVTNGDGFGLAWYDHRTAPGLYRDMYPAWSDPNLRALCEQVRSHLFLGHVRASTGSAVARDNCHPFVVDRWSFMHNGQIGGFDGFRKQADMMIPDEIYTNRRGTTDSEVMFLLAHAYGLEEDPIAALSEAAGQLRALSEAHGCAPHMRISAALSDGEALYVMRASSDHIAPTVYYKWSDSRRGWAVVSEPLEMDETGWHELPPSHLARFTRSGVDLFPMAAG